MARRRGCQLPPKTPYDRFVITAFSKEPASSAVPALAGKDINIVGLFGDRAAKIVSSTAEVPAQDVTCSNRPRTDGRSLASPSSSNMKTFRGRNQLMTSGVVKGRMTNVETK